MSLLSIITDARKLACLGKSTAEISTALDCHMLTAIDARLWAERIGKQGRYEYLRELSESPRRTAGEAGPAATAGTPAGPVEATTNGGGE